MIPLGQEPRTLGELFWSQFAEIAMTRSGVAGNLETSLDQAVARGAITPEVYDHLKPLVSTHYAESLEFARQVTTYLNAARDDAEKFANRGSGHSPIPLRKHNQ